MFPLGGIPEDLKQQANRWYLDYIELMKYRRKPRYGRTKCFGCLLSPDAEDSALFIGINKVIARALEDDNYYNNSKTDTSNNINSSYSTSTGISIYPCKVLNRYTCPYDNKSTINDDDAMSNVDYLFALYDLAFQVELAFASAYSMSKSNETIYEADFEASKVKEIYANYHGDPYSFSTEYPLEENLSKVQRLSKVPIRNVQDVYNVLTDTDMFDKLLQQGLEEEYQQYKDQIVEFFMRIKNRVRIEDLIVYEPTSSFKREKSKCLICEEFANIHCINCSNNDVWLCVDHWKQHEMEYHNRSKQ
jgi:hypothetical protein